jgi:hypothetical protein
MKPLTALHMLLALSIGMNIAAIRFILTQPIPAPQLRATVSVRALPERPRQMPGVFNL